MKEQWILDLRKLIENWRYEAGDDVLASVLADEVIEKVKNICQKAKAEERKRVAEDICMLIDNIEMKSGESTFAEWKQYKAIRNAIRDKYVFFYVLSKKNL